MIRQVVQHAPMGHTTPMVLVGQSVVNVSNSSSRRLHNSGGALPVIRLSSKVSVTNSVDQVGENIFNAKTLCRTRKLT